jgi:hypothetical protein
MKWRIWVGALVAALVVIQAGCDTCCRRTQLRPVAPCCPPGGGAVLPAPPPSVSQFPPATYYGR